MYNNFAILHPPTHRYMYSTLTKKVRKSPIRHIEARILPEFEWQFSPPREQIRKGVVAFSKATLHMHCVPFGSIQFLSIYVLFCFFLGICYFVGIILKNIYFTASRLVLCIFDWQEKDYFSQHLIG
jgi:hypothetical protein